MMKNSINNHSVNHQTKDYDDDIADLQSKTAYLELTIDSLDLVVAKQDKQIQDMQRQLQLVYRHIHSQSDSEIAPFNASTDIPPHY